MKLDGKEGKRNKETKKKSRHKITSKIKKVDIK